MHQNTISPALFPHPVLLLPPGTVPPYGFLECEFVCQPSYSSPDSAQFLLAVEGEGLEEEPPASNLVTLVANVSVQLDAANLLHESGTILISRLIWLLCCSLV